MRKAAAEAAAISDQKSPHAALGGGGVRLAEHTGPGRMEQTCGRGQREQHVEQDLRCPAGTDDLAAAERQDFLVEASPDPESELRGLVESLRAPAGPGQKPQPVAYTEMAKCAAKATNMARVMAMCAARHQLSRRFATA